jgi:Tfp pilus assembly protein PilF
MNRFDSDIASDDDCINEVIMRLSSSIQTVMVVATSTLLAACAALEPPPPAPVIAITDLTQRPAEQALLGGIRAYEDAQYETAEKSLRDALRLGLAAPRDTANAHKYLAFIFCTSNRFNECETAFIAAKKADPGFDLNKTEIGHPLWGSVYRKVSGSK